MQSRISTAYPICSLKSKTTVTIRINIIAVWQKIADAESAAVWQVTETAPASPGASSAFPNGSVFVTMGSFDAPLFDDDPGVIGRWQLVDIVDRITSFNPKKPQYTGEFHKWELTFCIDGVRGGVMAMFTLPDGYQQTQDHLDYPFLESAGTHEFKEIDGVRYMFVEDKSSADNTNYVVWKQS